KTGDADFEPPKFTKVDSLNDKTGIIPFPELQINTPYEYQIGYIKTKKDAGLADLSGEIIHIKNWDRASTGKFHTPNPNAEQLSFVFGSCYRYTSVLHFELGASGKRGSRIFRSISEQLKNDPANGFFLRIGDNVYFDPIGKISFGQSKTLDDMRETYRTVWGFPNYRNLLANTITYSQKDDHDSGFNNAIPLEEICDAEIVAHAEKSFFEYQKWDGPNGSQKLYYSFSRGPAEFFVFDTREERVNRTKNNEGIDQIPHMINPEQFKAFQDWIQNPAIQNKVKFVVTTVPLISTADADAWAGFPAQQRQIVETILGNDRDGTPITKAFILTGDGHCTHGGTYNINNEAGQIGTLTEIMSSGLKSIVSFGSKDDFPAAIDIRDKGGLHFVKIDQSDVFPDTSKADGIIGKIGNLICENVDGVFVRMDINLPENILTMNTFNQNNVLLGSKTYPIVAQ
ncbi:MAG: alkaline phosphatase D family protein, partial [Alphaproteobacteria bacterium]|nr:alkaline phosphatase D family protein [Alphaproteobacteria bacterium]